MPFIIRWAIILVAVLFTNRVIPGYQIGSYWFEFFEAIVIAWLNAAIRPFVRLILHSNSWALLGLCGFILNFILYGLITLGVLKSVEIEVIAISAPIWSGLIVWIIATLCNHYLEPRRGK